MSTLFFSIPNQLTIKISSDKDLLFTDSEYLLLKGYIPSITRLRSEPEQIDVIVEHVESEDKKLIQEGNHVRIFDTWKGIFSADLYHLLYGVVRPQLLKRKLFPIHGACVGKDNENSEGGYVLIVGHSGAGKTSTLLKLLQDADTKVFSGNKTVVSFSEEKSEETSEVVHVAAASTRIKTSKLMAVAGTPTITIRGSDKERWNDLSGVEHVEYWDRYAFMLNPQRYAVSKAVWIKAIAVVRLNDYVEENQIINPLSALHNLYPYFLDVVNADVVISDTEGVFIGTPPSGTEKYLVSALKSALAEVPVHSLIGSSSFVASEILKLMKS